MNLQETVFSIFPGCTLMDTASDDGVVEVSGIGISMVPQNCEVLVRGVAQDPQKFLRMGAGPASRTAQR